MRVILTLSLMLFTPALVALSFIRSEPEREVQGNISIQQMLCETQEGSFDLTFLLTATNTTNQALKNLKLSLNVANGDDIQEKVIPMNLVDEGETIRLKEIITFENKITACFAKFKQGNQDIRANFRPIGDYYENN